jgi:hypothetical protein
MVQIEGTEPTVVSRPVQYRRTGETSWQQWTPETRFALERNASLELRFPAVRSPAQLLLQHEVVGSAAPAITVLPWKPPEDIDLELVFAVRGAPRPAQRIEGRYQVVVGDAPTVDARVNNGEILLPEDGGGRSVVPRHWIRALRWEYGTFKGSTTLDEAFPFGPQEGDTRLTLAVDFTRGAPARRTFGLFFCTESLEDGGISLRQAGTARELPQVEINDLGPLPREFREKLAEARAKTTWSPYNLPLFAEGLPTPPYVLSAEDTRKLTVELGEKYPAGNWITLEAEAPVKEAGTTWADAWRLALAPQGMGRDHLYFMLTVKDTMADPGARVLCVLGRKASQTRVRPEDEVVTEPRAHLELESRGVGIRAVKIERIAVDDRNRLGKEVRLSPGTTTVSSDPFEVTATWKDEGTVVAIDIRTTGSVFPPKAKLAVRCSVNYSLGPPDEWDPIRDLEKKSWLRRLPQPRARVTWQGITWILCGEEQDRFYAMETELLNRHLVAINRGLQAKGEDPVKTEFLARESDDRPARGFASFDDARRAARALGAAIPSRRDWNTVVETWYAAVDFTTNLEEYQRKQGHRLTPLDRDGTWGFLKTLGVRIDLEKGAPRDAHVAGRSGTADAPFVNVLGNVAELARVPAPSPTGKDTFFTMGRDFRDDSAQLPARVSSSDEASVKALKEWLAGPFRLDEFNYATRRDRWGLRLVIREKDNPEFWKQALSSEEPQARDQ